MNDQPIRVLFLSDHLGYAGGVIHGATTYFLNVLPALRQRGAQLTVCFLRERHPVADQLESQGIRPIFLNRGKWNPLAVIDLVRIGRRERVDLIHAAGMKGILMGRLAGIFLRKPVIVHLHDTNPLDAVTRSLQRLLAFKTDLALGVSGVVCEYAQRVLRTPAARTRTLYNALPASAYDGGTPKEIRQLWNAFRLPPSSRVLSIIGRLSEEKGHGPFLEAFASIRNRVPKTVLLIVGEGPLRASLEARVKELDLEDAVRFTGYRDDVPDLLSITDVTVVPSIREGFSYAALESLAAGKPVAAFRVGGVPEIIEHDRTGLLAEPGDLEELTGHVIRLLTDVPLAHRLQEAGRRRARDFSMERHTTQLLAMYRELLAR